MPCYTISVTLPDIDAADVTEAAGAFCSVLACADWSGGLTVEVDDAGTRHQVKVPLSVVEAGLADARPLGFRSADLRRIIRVLGEEAADMMADMMGSTMDSPKARREKEAEHAGLLATIAAAKAALPDAPFETAPAAVRSALIQMRAAIRTLPGIDPFVHGDLATADTLAALALGANDATIS